MEEISVRQGRLMTEIKLYNTKTRRKEVFIPLDSKDVRIYVCGPTVYDRAHIGNARPVIVFDILYRLLREIFEVDHVRYARNFTDVDDKINATAAERKAAGATGTLEELIRERTEETISWYLEDMGALGNLEPDHAPRATEYVQEMIDMSVMLIEQGYAYEAESHVLFDVTSYENYGSLSGRSVKDMIAGARVEVAPFKRNPMDFVLWKPSDVEQPGWQSPWGRGRPGWHVECSAMAEKLFGKRFDIHGGGLDLAFPHHENEKAQSCACGEESDFAQVWMHNEMLQVEGKKMSKSLGNFFSVRELIDQGYPGEVIRLVFLGTHYRKPMDWTDKKAREAEVTLRRAAKLLSSDPSNILDLKAPQEFVDALANDLNTSLALTFIKKYLKEGDRIKLASSLTLLGFDIDVLVKNFASLEPSQFKNVQMEGNALRSCGDAVDSRLSELANQLLVRRENAMLTKDFTTVDALKSALIDAGVSVQMSKDGVTLEPAAGFDASKLEDLL